MTRTNESSAKNLPACTDECVRCGEPIGTEASRLVDTDQPVHNACLPAHA
jgi:hypothetical protein